jgi:hypothetical protein
VNRNLTTRRAQKNRGAPVRRSLPAERGGAGFLGSFVVEKLRQRGCKDIFVPRSREYDLRQLEAIQRMPNDAGPISSFTRRHGWKGLAQTGLTQPSRPMAMIDDPSILTKAPARSAG